MYLNVNNSVGLVEKNQILPDHDVLNSKELTSRNTVEFRLFLIQSELSQKSDEITFQYASVIWCTYSSSKRWGCCDMSQNDTIGKIELNPSSIFVK